MSETETEGGRLFQLYARYVGEPDSKKDVYGYWLFFFGSIVGFAGVAIFLLGTETGITQSGFVDVNDFVRVAYVIAASGLPLALLGIVLLLPVQRWGIGLTLVGTAVSLYGIFMFSQAFPTNWPPIQQAGAVDRSPQIVAVYAGGIAVITLVTMLVPVFTGEKSLFFRQEYERSQEYPDVEIGKALHGGMFSVYKEGEEWTWRLIEENAVAGSVEDYLSRLETEESVERIKEKVAQASLMEIKTAAFRLYEASEDTWQWVLMREDGSRVANSEDEYASQNDAADAVNELKERGPTADVIEIEEGGAFTFVERGSSVHWQLVDSERQVLGEGPTGYNGRSAAENAVEGARAVAADARTLAVQDFGVELYKRGEVETAIEVYDDDAAAEDLDTESATGGPWNWRLVDSTDTTLAISQSGYDARRELEERVYDILETIQTVPVLDSSQPGYEIHPDGDGWSWRLLDDNERVVGRTHHPQTGQDAARNGAQLMREHAGDADIVSIDDAEFEYFRTADGWHWRLVTEAREPIAVSTSAFDSKQQAANAIDDVQKMADDADLIEFENAAAQVYEHAGEWRWRFIDEDGNVMADSGEEHDSKESAMGELMTIMESASDAEVLEIETAAFELYNDEDDDWWNWRLVNLAGETVARGAEEVETREEARENMDRLVESGVDTNVREVTGAIFQVYADDASEWHWRFVHEDGSIVADSEETYATRDEAATALSSDIRPAAAGADVDVIESLALQVDQRGDRYTWRIIDSERETIAASTRSYVDRGEVTQLLAQLQEQAMDSTVFELKDHAFHVTHGDAGWDWELVDDQREALMQSDETFGTLAEARESIDHIQSIIEDAGIVDVEDAAFEIYQYEDRWRWQLIDAAENVMASGAQDYASRSAVENAIEEIRSELDDASIIDIERAAFELTEDDGMWKWRLIDETGNPVAASLKEYDSRREAREAMDVLKDYGPEALTQVAE